MAKIQCNVISYTLKRTVDITVILPTVTIPEALIGVDGHDPKPTHKIKEKYPVVYLLHGFGNNQDQWGGYTNVELYAEERRIAIVMIAGENKAYLNRGEDLFEDFIEKELKEFITSTFPISAKAEHNYIAGLSMGGFGALYHGIKYPSHYAAIGAFSAAVERPTTDNTKIISIVDQQLSKKKKLPNIFLTCGTDDFLYKRNQKFARDLKKRNITYTWISEKGYVHEWRFWDLSIERFLDWIPRTDIYKNTKRKV